MIILGIDPGTSRIGYGVITADHAIFKIIAYGCLEIEKQRKKEFRLPAIHNHINELIALYKPAQAAMEKLFFQNNQKTVMAVSEARGVIYNACAMNSIPVSEYAPLQIKHTITGYGKADKKQMQKMVQLLLRLPDIPRPDDAADALAIAISHALLSREHTSTRAQ
jgi:crossover junction endodeoxyribonuclease RuvC